jgi:hypothetical protein
MQVAIKLVGKNWVVEHHTNVCFVRTPCKIESSTPSKKKNPISVYHLSSSSHISLPPSSSPSSFPSSFYYYCANERFYFFSLTKTKLVLGIFVMMEYGLLLAQNA